MREVPTKPTPSPVDAPSGVCGKTWRGRGRDAKDHACILSPGHGLVCECDCGSRKWMGRSFAQLARESKERRQREESPSEESCMLKRFEDALRGRPLSEIAAQQINKAVGSRLPGLSSACKQGDKLPVAARVTLSQICFEMREQGNVPPQSLLTEHQKRAVERGRRG